MRNLLATVIVTSAVNASANSGQNQEITLAFFMSIKDVFMRTSSSVLMEGSHRTVSGRMEVTTPEGKVGIDIEPSIQILDAQMLIVKSKNRVTLLENGKSNSSGAQLVFDEEGKVIQISLQEVETEAAMKEALSAAEKQITQELQRRGVEVKSVELNVKETDCVPSDSDSLECKTGFDLIIKS